MKWSIVGLVSVGLVAALSAAILVAAIRAGALGGRQDLPTEVEVVIANVDLHAMAVVKAESLSTKKVWREDAPPQFLSNPVQVIGRVLSVPVTAGQAITRSCFAAEGKGIELASTIEEGMRAISVSLTDYSGLYGLLYPGSIVDVLAYLKLPYDNGQRGDAISVTLLRSVQVLGVEDQTVVSTEKDEDPKGLEGRRQQSKRWMVTLMVDPVQAQALQLATENGRISLAMRNPMDRTPTAERPATYIGELTGRRPRGQGSPFSLAKLLGTPETSAEAIADTGSAIPASMADGVPALLRALQGRGSKVARTEAAYDAGNTSAEKQRQWEMEILRGSVSEKIVLPLEP